MTHGMSKTLERRADLTTRLAFALAHLNRDVALEIVAAFIPLDQLEEIVRFQERT